MLNIQCAGRQGLTLGDFFVETTFTAGRLLQPLLSPHRHLLLPQVQLDLHHLLNLIFIHLLRIEATLPLSSLFQSSNGTPVANCSSGKSKTGFDEISGSVLLVLRAVTQQPLGFWTDRDWVGEGSQHLVETEVVIVGGDEKCGVYPSSTKRAIIGATYLKKIFDNSATFSFYSSF